jgi:alpha-D-xyloside xylohydrolase
MYPKGVKDPAFRELYVRWLEFGTFCPMMRSHGEATPREIYQFGNKGDWAYDAIEKFINFRYRLQPYIYSNAWAITSRSSTLMRALVMDFKQDTAVYNINNEYLFGKSILVNPVTDSFYVNRSNGDTAVNMLNNYTGKLQTQKVYLPKGTEWIDFWTGEKFEGGQQTEKAVPIDLIPLYVRAGAIIPLGPFKQYWNEKQDSNLEIRVYEGADGQFTLYEDEGDNYNYEKGKYATMDFSWNNKERTLTIGDRKGQFAGFLQNRTFQLVLVKKGNGVGINDSKPNKTISYEGKKLKVKF